MRRDASRIDVLLVKFSNPEQQMSFAVGRRPKKSGALFRLEEPEPRHVVPAAYFRWKDLPGRCLALVLFLAGLPIMAMTMLAVRIFSPGPTLYKQVRVGRNGQNFTMYKIRTMRVDAEAGTGPVWTQLHDPRVTPVGRWIRRLHLDEFPQLVNVLKGEMALIGPRPERPEFTQRLAVAIPGYLDRLAVRPGITGLAQINLPPDTDLDSVRRKLAVDLIYVREGSLWLDLRILACTFARLFALRGPCMTRLLGLEHVPHLPPAVPSSRRRLLEDSGLDLERMNGDATCQTGSSEWANGNGRSKNGHNGHTGSPNGESTRTVDLENGRPLGGRNLPR